MNRGLPAWTGRGQGDGCGQEEATAVEAKTMVETLVRHVAAATRAGGVIKCYMVATLFSEEVEKQRDAVDFEKL